MHLLGGFVGSAHAVHAECAHTVDKTAYICEDDDWPLRGRLARGFACKNDLIALHNVLTNSAAQFAVLHNHFQHTNSTHQHQPQCSSNNQ